MYGTDTDIGSNHNGSGEHQPIFHRRSKSGDVAGRFTSPGVAMSEAITSTYIVSDSQLNNIIRLWHKAVKWNVKSAQADLLIKVNGIKSQVGRSIWRCSCPALRYLSLNGVWEMSVRRARRIWRL